MSEEKPKLDRDSPEYKEWLIEYKEAISKRNEEECKVYEYLINEDREKTKWLSTNKEFIIKWQREINQIITEEKKEEENRKAAIYDKLIIKHGSQWSDEEKKQLEEKDE